eukprot:g184.t1
MEDGKGAALLGRKGSAASVGDGPVEHNALGTFNGCFIPCCLNILGIILFQRLAWAVGQAGISGVLLIFLLAEAMAILTVLSFSAIVTNGSMKGGGSYFMISRSLGPEFGGAIGLLFYLAYAIGVSFYISGFSLAVRTNFFEDQPEYSFNLIIGSVGLVGVTVISYVGAGIFAKFNVIFFFVQTLAILLGIVSVLYSSGHLRDVDMNDVCSHNRPFEAGSGLVNICGGANQTDQVYKASTAASSWEHIKENWHMDFDYAMESQACNDGVCDFHSVFAIVFPAATGIMEGANLSGDLKDPSRSIPKGTLMAVAFAILTYVGLTFAMGASYPRASLKFDMDAFQDATMGAGYPLFVGIVVSSLSSALGSLFGGARVLQALARDKLFPWPLNYIEFFAQGSKIGDEPQRAVIMTWAIAQCGLLLGSIDAIAPVQTGFFCLSYALCNLTCFALKITGAPNFRPKFKWFCWQSALVGFILNVAVMFWLNWLSALVSTFALVCIFMIILFKGPRKDWGDLSQALMWHQVRKYVLMLDTKKHAKFWRPSYLLLVNDIGAHGLVDFCEKSKKGGLFLIGNVMVGDVFALADSCRNLRHKWVEQIRGSHIKALPKVTIAPSTRLGYQFLMISSGIGGLDLNTVVLPLDKASRMPSTSLVGKSLSPAKDSEETKSKRLHLKTHVGNLHAALDDEVDYVETIKDALRLRRNVLLAANFKDAVLMKNEPGSFIDVWIGTDLFLAGKDRDCLASVDSDTTGAFMVHIAFILSENPKYCKESRLRVFKILPVSQKHHAETVAEELAESLTLFRINAICECVTIANAPSASNDIGDNFSQLTGQKARLRALAEVVHQRSTKTESCMVFMELPSIAKPARDLVDADYFDDLEVISDPKAMPAVAFCKKGEKGRIIYEFI